MPLILAPLRRPLISMRFPMRTAISAVTVDVSSPKL
jgi:hypothetical protein